MDLKALLRRKAESGMILVDVVPKSSRSGIVSYSEETGCFRVKVSAPPAKGKANTELERFLSGLLGKKVRVVSGRTSRRKTLRVA